MENSSPSILHDITEHLGLHAKTPEEHLEAASSIENHRAASLAVFGGSLLCIASAEIAQGGLDPAVTIAMGAVAASCEAIYLTLSPRHTTD